MAMVIVLAPRSPDTAASWCRHWSHLLGDAGEVPDNPDKTSDSRIRTGFLQQ